MNYFSNKTQIPISKIGIKGSSQGASKVPYILNKLPDLNYGIVVSCPGVTLLESDLNYWKNSNSKEIGNDIDEAVNLQGDVFRFIAGTLSKNDLEKLIKSKKDKGWFKNIWIPNLDEVKTNLKKTLKSKITEIIPSMVKMFMPDVDKMVESFIEKDGDNISCSCVFSKCL